jgi:hypothetical protein
MAMKKAAAKTYWLHVTSDGVEHRFDDEPDGLRCLRVETTCTGGKIVERTFVNNVLGADGPIHPKGRDWSFESFGSSTWTRVRKA